MVLVDTSVWIDHLRVAQAELVAELESARVLVHPLVIGEIALGSLRHRADVVSMMSALPSAVVAQDEEVMALIERYSLHGCGIGYLDAHLLTSVRLTPGATLWTRDRRLQSAAQRLGLCRPIAH